MFDRVRLVLGILWASPMTLVGLVYVFLCWGMGWYRYVGWRQPAWVWCHSGVPMPRWLHGLWHGWDGHSIGSLVVLRDAPEPGTRAERMLAHELEHARQQMVLGVFAVVLYILFNLAIRAIGEHVHPYWDSPLEIAARRKAGQLVDVWGMKMKLDKKQKGQ